MHESANQDMTANLSFQRENLFLLLDSVKKNLKFGDNFKFVTEIN